MSATLAERVETLEHEMAELLKKVPSHGEPSPQGWMSTFGMFANDPLFEAAMESGEVWRKQQTWERESRVAEDAGALCCLQGERRI